MLAEKPTADVSGYKLVKVKANNTLSLSVPIRGNPRPKVEWSRNDKLLSGEHFSWYKS